MTTEETYLAWMRYALWGGELNVSHSGLDPESLSAVLSLADRQKTRGLVFEAMLRSGVSVSEKVAAGMKQVLLQIIASHQMLDTAVVQVFEALRQAGIPAVLLKGQGVARNYPDPQLRECGDIDIYIGAERLEEAVRTLTPLADKVDDELHGKHLELWIGRAEIELHLQTMLPPTRSLTRFYSTLEADGLRHDLVPLDFSCIRVDTPADTFNAFYIFYHAWHHFIGGGIGFRQLCDWALFLHARRDGIDRERLRAMLEGMRLLPHWQMLGCIAVHDLGLPEAECPFYDSARFAKSRRVLEIILDEGNFGRGWQPRCERPKRYFASKAYSLGIHTRRFLRMSCIAPAEAWRNFRQVFTHGFGIVFKDLLHK